MSAIMTVQLVTVFIIIINCVDSNGFLCSFKPMVCNTIPIMINSKRTYNTYKILFMAISIDYGNNKHRLSILLHY